MCFSDEQIQRVCGLLILKETNEFVYCCRQCECEYSTGSSLESHVLLEHVKEVDDVDGCLVSGEIVDETFEVPIEAEDEQQIEEANGEPAVQEMVGDQGIESANEESPSDIEQTGSKLPHSSNGLENDRNHGIEKRIQPTSARVLYCDMCPEVSFNYMSHLKEHMNYHTVNKNRKSCSICQKTPLNYGKHMKRFHLIAKPFICEFCEASYRRKDQLTIHVRKHTGEKPWSCPSCDKSFRAQNARDKHNMRTHTKKLPEPECTRSLMSPPKLQDHSTRPVCEYVCDICSKKFTTKNYLNAHKQSHGDKVHPCKYCKKLFKTTNTKRNHERTIHETKGSQTLEIELA